MVWGLFPADPLPGEETYYFFSKGTYKVGRKGCDIIVNKDKGVSRVHAEIIIDAMISIDNIKEKSSVKSSKIRIKDCSKYGTFIKKPIGSKEKVQEFPNKETTLDDADLVSFGTGNATYRLEFIPVVFFLCGFEPAKSKELQEKILSIGACVINKWSQNCTHVVLGDNSSLNGDVVDAIMSKKHFVSYKWIESLADKNIDTKIPSCSSDTITLQGVSVKFVEPESREFFLNGYTFLLEPSEKYKVREKLQPLLETFGAKVVDVEEYIPHSQGLEEDENNHVVHVIEGDGTECSHNFGFLPKVSEINLICATLSGCLDPVVFVSPPVHVTSSCSTDETVVADSEPEIEIISVSTSSTIPKLESIENENEKEKEKEKEKISVQQEVKKTVHLTDPPIKVDSYVNIATNDTKDDELIVASGISDVIFSQDLIIRDINLPSFVPSPTKNQVLDFKRFKKMATQSGNSYYNLVPFSKNPYKGSEYENEGVAESLKEEKKRKHQEAVADDLFNNSKAKKRGATGFIQGLFNRR